MADTNLKVQIKFQATGDKELARAFKTAAIASEKLEKDFIFIQESLLWVE